MYSTETIKMMYSASPEVRLQGLLAWWIDEGQRSVERSLWRFTRNKQEIEDLLSETYLKLLVWLQNYCLKKPSVAAFAKKVAYHHWIDRRRRQKTEARKINLYAPKAFSIVEPDELLINAQARQLILHLKGEKERILALLYFQANCERHEIASLTGWSSKWIKNGLARLTRQLPKMAKEGKRYEQQASQWEEALPANGLQNMFGITLINVSLQNLAHDSENELASTLGVKDSTQAAREYMTMLRLVEIDSPTPQFALTFARRSSIEKGILGHEKIYYQDYMPRFHRDGTRGQYVMELKAGASYEAQLQKTVYGEQAPYPMLEWHFVTDSPAHKIMMHKPFSPQLATLLSNQNQGECLALYRLYVLNGEE